MIIYETVFIFFSFFFLRVGIRHTVLQRGTSNIKHEPNNQKTIDLESLTGRGYPLSLYPLLIGLLKPTVLAGPPATGPNRLWPLNVRRQYLTPLHSKYIMV